MNPKRLASVHQQQRARHHASALDAYSLLELLNNPALSDQVEAAMPACRHRQFPPLQTLSLFMDQALSAVNSLRRNNKLL